MRRTTFAGPWLFLLMLATGCGPHLIMFENPSLMHQPSYHVRTTHAHGFGPLLIGGGGYFFLVDEISPALIDYTGPVDTRSVCPDGFAEVQHSRSFGENVAAAAISWVALFNVWHESNVDWQCLRPKPAPSQPPAAGVPTPPTKEDAP